MLRPCTRILRQSRRCEAERPASTVPSPRTCSASLQTELKLEFRAIGLSDSSIRSANYRGKELSWIVGMSHMTQMEIAKSISEQKPVILPTGATEAHGPHMPTDTDTHQAEHIALRLAEQIDAVVAPPVAYGISKTFEFFPGTISLSIPTYQTMIFEIGAALIRQGFRHLIILERQSSQWHRQRSVARLLVDELDGTLISLSRPSAIGSRPRPPSCDAKVRSRGHGPWLRTGDLLSARDAAEI